jgi:hypothetical protein
MLLNTNFNNISVISWQSVLFSFVKIQQQSCFLLSTRILLYSFQHAVVVSWSTYEIYFYSVTGNNAEK